MDVLVALADAAPRVLPADALWIASRRRSGRRQHRGPDRRPSARGAGRSGARATLHPARPRHGYRLIAPVERVDSGAGPETDAVEWFPPRSAGPTDEFRQSHPRERAGPRLLEAHRWSRSSASKAREDAAGTRTRRCDVVDVRDGVWFVELASLTDPTQISQAIGAALRLREIPGQAVGRHVGGGAGTQAGIVGARQLRTPHRRLRPAGGVAAATGANRQEPMHEPRSAGMQVNIPGESRRSRIRTRSECRPFANSVRSSGFDYRSTARRRRSELPSDSGEREIRRADLRPFDGIPFAIELAAARLRAMTAAQICSRLDDRFRLLTGGRRTAVPRQQTLQATFDWSHELLEEREQVLLRRFAVISAGFRLESAETVAGVDPLACASIVDLLTRLVDKSWVQASSRTGGHRVTECSKRFVSTRTRDCWTPAKANCCAIAIATTSARRPNRWREQIERVISGSP